MTFHHELWERPSPACTHLLSDPLPDQTLPSGEEQRGWSWGLLGLGL